jgi:hypothetical protein
MSSQDDIETKLYQLYDNELNIVKKYKNLDKKVYNQSYQIIIGFIVFLIVAASITGGSVYGFYKSHTIEKIDAIRFNSAIYTQWVAGVPPSDSVTVGLNRINKNVYLNIKNSTNAINLILPLASTLKNGDFILFYFKNDSNHLDQVYYLFENLINSIFVGQFTYYINSVFDEVKVTVVNNKWTVSGSGII